MVKKFESIDTISLFDLGKVDTQYLSRRGFLERIEVSEDSGHIRSKVVFGRFQLPEIGKLFCLIAEPFNENLLPETDLRNITTSRVTSVEKEGNEIYFETMNSKYKLSLV